MKYVSFIVEEKGCKYCINAGNINYFVESNKIKILDDHRGDKSSKGVALFRDKLMRVINTKDVFCINKFISNQIIIMNVTNNRSVLIPVFKIIEIFESDNIEQISANSKQFNFIIKKENELFILVENYFFDVNNF